jgi:Helix-turn-helix domain
MDVEMGVQTGAESDTDAVTIVDPRVETVVDPGDVRPDLAQPDIRQPGGSAAPSTGGRDPREREPLWRDLIGDVLRRERQAQERTLQEVADAARISMPYLSELERGRKEGSSEILAAAAHALGLRLSDLISLAYSRLGEYEKVASAGRPVGVASRDSLCLAA